MDLSVEFEPLLTESEAARWLNLSVHTLRNDRSRRLVGVPYVQLGRVIRYDPAELRAWLTQCRRTPVELSVPKRRGRPTVAEREEARRAGLTVQQLRRRSGGGESS